MKMLRKRLERLENALEQVVYIDCLAKVNDAALAKLSGNDRALLATRPMVVGPQDSELWSRWEAAVDAALGETRCPVRFCAEDWRH